MNYYIIKDVLELNKYSEINETDFSMLFLESPMKKNLLFRCPRCGYENFFYDSGGLEILSLSEGLIGDFIYGSTHPRYHFTCSNKMLSILRETKGLKSFKKIDKVFKSDKEVDTENMYAIELHRSTAILSRKNSKLKMRIKKTRKKCKVCNPDGYMYLIINGVELDNVSEDYDIFVLYENPTLIFINDNFLMMCREKGITNFLDKVVPLSEYTNDFESLL